MNLRLLMIPLIVAFVAAMLGCDNAGTPDSLPLRSILSIDSSDGNKLTIAVFGNVGECSKCMLSADAVLSLVRHECRRPISVIGIFGCNRDADLAFVDNSDSIFTHLIRD